MCKYSLVKTLVFHQHMHILQRWLSHPARHVGLVQSFPPLSSAGEQPGQERPRIGREVEASRHKPRFVHNVCFSLFFSNRSILSLHAVQSLNFSTLFENNNEKNIVNSINQPTMATIMYTIYILWLTVFLKIFERTEEW